LDRFFRWISFSGFRVSYFYFSRKAYEGFEKAGVFPRKGSLLAMSVFSSLLCLAMGRSVVDPRDLDDSGAWAGIYLDF